MMKTIQILGISEHEGTIRLRNNTEKALQKLGVDINCEEITDIEQLLNYNLIGIPAMAIDGEIMFQKSNPSFEELTLMFQVILHKTSEQDTIQNILVPTDLSLISRVAYQYAHCLAAHIRASLDILTIYTPNFQETMPYYLKRFEQDLMVKRQLLQQFIKEEPLLPSCCDDDQVEVPESFRVLCGHPAQEIVGQSKTEEVDLIVMSTTGNDHLYTKLLGSTSTTTALNAACPVLLIPENVKYSCPRKILYATNYHPNEAEGLKQLVFFTKHFNAHVHIVHVQNETTISNTTNLNYRKSELFYNTLPNIHYSMTTITQDDPIVGLNEYMEQHEIDLVVMPTVNRPFLSRLFHKSTTKRMAIQSKIPLMVLHI